MAGPIALDVSLSWVMFLELIGKGLEVTTDRLVIRSFNWKFQKPANSKAVSLYSDAGYYSMIQHISGKPDIIPVVVITMDAPLKQSQSVRSLVSSSSCSFIIQYILNII